MNFVLDTHSHTVASGHAYSTAKEMIDQAAVLGLELLCITDHAPMMPGSTHPFYFSNLNTIPRKVSGVEVLKGAEANILNYAGEIDLEPELLKRLDIVIASFHPPCYEAGTKEENTQAMINTMKNPYVHIIGHPDDSRYPIDYDMLVKAAKDNGVLLEVNNSSLKPGHFRQGASENIRTMITYCKKYEVPIVVGSDAHFYTQVGEADLAKVILQEMNMPEELIANTSVTRFKELLNRKFQK
ncbi:MAG: phosphatase [Epulopiscium sp.]|nr:phosphatase [Candidatus Epulonipiscium sp.]